MSTVRVFCPGINFCAQMFFSFFSVFFFLLLFSADETMRKYKDEKKTEEKKRKMCFIKNKCFSCFYLFITCRWTDDCVFTQGAFLGFARTKCSIGAG